MALPEILALDDLGDDTWRARTPPGTRRSDIFGGQVAAQALAAASRTVDASHFANSVHCSFLRRGQPTLPLDIHVARTRQGRTYSNRHVEVVQDGKVVFAMLASFHQDEPGREYDHPMPEGIPDPDALATPVPQFNWERDPVLEMRTVDIPEPTVRWWGRCPGDYGDDPALHLCGLLYASDMRAGGAAMSAVGVPFAQPIAGEERPTGSFGSLDHALWFHRVPRVDEWFFVEVQPLTVRDSRGLVLGRMFDREGRHLATFAQEMFLKIAG